ncbi:MAG TPA: glucosidase [Verrucomicrobiae bacterium]|nr:glucosidase [Verrucomicrobiae bacterium]
MQERLRLEEARNKKVPWRKWGPYLSERQWGTVREDYSNNGDAWSYFSHDQARSRAYRWGEDGIAGLCDDRMQLCFAIALWNENDPILKERLFGLTNAEGNHGEDVKEYYFYIDSTPTHSYMKMLYKYPQRAFPYTDLIETNRARGRAAMEYELLDSGVFNEDRYFDVFVEYAKAAPEDIFARITVVNRGPEPAPLHLLAQLWFRNTWWDRTDAVRPMLRRGWRNDKAEQIVAEHPELGIRYLYYQIPREVLFTENETNLERIFGIPNTKSYVKDGINNCVVHRQTEAVNPQQIGTKAAPHYMLMVKPGEEKTVRVRLSDVALPAEDAPLGAGFDRIFSTRVREADEFYAPLTSGAENEDEAQVIRQGFAGMLWSKQAYLYEVNEWLKEHGGSTSDGPVPIRNSQWFHMTSADIISMPDKWEYPWFAAWDLAFHTLALTLVDPDFASEQLELILCERYLHPNGQMPAYEWNFGDVNPPVHAWATIYNYRLVKGALGNKALENLKNAFHKMLLNFTWWVNRKDRTGRNVFEGGFLGLDNIGAFDRSAPLPTGGYLEQADGTAWMALYSQNMLEIALELALHDPVYENLAIKFYEHFIWISSAMTRVGECHDSMWDEEDGFYYDILRLPDGNATRLKVRSMVGLLPLCAATVYPREVLLRLPNFASRVMWFNHHRPHLLVGMNPSGRQGANGRYMLSVLNDDKLRRVLARMLDPNEFLSDYGIRALSRYHAEHPYVFRVGSEEYKVGYLPAESDSGLFGGNSNWRGPIWMPMNALLIRALLQMYSYYGDTFKVECPTGSGVRMTLFEVARELSCRLSRIFLRNSEGRRPVYGGTEKFQTDPHWRDLILFFEYFHGDNGAGLGASHQTGWTGLVSLFMYAFGRLKPDDILERGLNGLADTALAQSSIPITRDKHTRPIELPIRKKTKPPSKRAISFSASSRSKPRSQRLHGEDHDTTSPDGPSRT